MFVSRPTAALIRGRLDAEAYNPEFLGAAEALSASGLPVESIDDVSERIRCGPFGSSLHASRYVENGVPFIAPVAFSAGHVDIDSVERISAADHVRLQGTSFRPPSILFARVGHPHVAPVPEAFGEFNIHGDVIGAKLSAGNDAHFLYSFFTCAHGSRLLRQAQAGTTRPRINTPDLAAIPVVRPSTLAQRYIGSKVRQADALREWARELTMTSFQSVSDLFRDQARTAAPNQRHARIQPGALLERLNADAYGWEHLQDADSLAASGLPLRPLGELVDAPINNSIRNVTEALGAGDCTVPMFRPADISGMWVDPRTAPMLPRDFESGHEKSRVLPGDLVLGIAGTIGVAGRVPPTVPFGNINGSSARIRPRAELRGYLTVLLNSPLGSRLLTRWSVGAVQKHLNLEDLPSILLPVPDAATLGNLNRWVDLAEWATIHSRSLLTAARLLVEALIERKVTEAELIEAGKDSDADRALLARLAEDGLDGPGAPLFSDLDGLAELIAEAQRPGGAS